MIQWLLLAAAGAPLDESALRTAWVQERWAEVAALLEPAAADAPVMARRRYLILLASARAAEGDVERAFAALAEAVDAGYADRAEVEADDGMSLLADDPRLAQLLDRMDASRRFHEADALSTPYRGVLPAAERAAGLALLWSEVRNHFAYFDQVPDLDWDSRFLQAMDDALAAPDTFAYYGVLQRLAAELRDGHTGVRLPHVLRAGTSARPAVETRLVEGVVVVEGVHDDEVPLEVGDVLLSVDGKEVHAWVAEHILPTVSASTPQWRDRMAYGPRLLEGVAGVDLTVQIRRGRRVRDVVLSRGTAALPDRPPTAWTADRGIGHLTLNTFDSGQVVQEVHARWPEIAAQRGLVVDLRRNGGGNSSVGFQVLATLTDTPFATGCWQTRLQHGTDAPWGAGQGWTAPRCGTFAPDGTRHFTGPVAVLIGPDTYSAAEDFVVAFEAMGRGMLVGTTTGGSTGQPRTFGLPGGGSFRVCAKRDTHPDGRPWVGHGLAPDLEVPITRRAIARGEDPVQAAATRHLRQRLAERSPP